MKLLIIALVSLLSTVFATRAHAEDVSVEARAKAILNADGAIADFSIKNDRAMSIDRFMPMLSKKYSSSIEKTDLYNATSAQLDSFLHVDRSQNKKLSELVPTENCQKIREYSHLLKEEARANRSANELSSSLQDRASRFFKQADCAARLEDVKVSSLPTVRLSTIAELTNSAMVQRIMRENEIAKRDGPSVQRTTTHSSGGIN